MNMQNVRLRFHNIGQDLKTIWLRFRHDLADEKKDHVMTEDEMIDEASRESFPASDPPGHFSKSSEDRALH